MRLSARSERDPQRGHVHRDQPLFQFRQRHRQQLLERERLLAPEYYPLVLLATAGMMFLAGAEDLIVLFLGLEVMSVAV